MRGGTHPNNNTMREPVCVKKGGRCWCEASVPCVSVCEALGHGGVSASSAPLGTSSLDLHQIGAERVLREHGSGRLEGEGGGAARRRRQGGPPCNQHISRYNRDRDRDRDPDPDSDPALSRPGPAQSTAAKQTPMPTPTTTTITPHPTATLRAAHFPVTSKRLAARRAEEDAAAMQEIGQRAKKLRRVLRHVARIDNYTISAAPDTAAVDVSADGKRIAMASTDAAVGFGHGVSDELVGASMGSQLDRPGTAPAGMITRAKGEGEDGGEGQTAEGGRVVDGDGASVVGSDAGSLGRFGGNDGGFSGGNVPATMDDMRMNYRLK